MSSRRVIVIVIFSNITSIYTHEWECPSMTKFNSLHGPFRVNMASTRLSSTSSPIYPLPNSFSSPISPLPNFFPYFSLGPLGTFSIAVDDITNHGSLKLVGKENYLLWHFQFLQVFNSTIGFCWLFYQPTALPYYWYLYLSTFFQRLLLELVSAWLNHSKLDSCHPFSCNLGSNAWTYNFPCHVAKASKCICVKLSDMYS